ncbi:uncharacterized protein AB9W97_001970 [Spinachia spinachia]
MDRDASSPSVDRTFWTVWYYITEAVNRFFRPEPTNLPPKDTNSSQDTSVDRERVDSGPSEGDAGERIVDEEGPPATDSLLGSSRPLVAWEFCTTEIDLGAEENIQYEVQPGEGSQRKAPEEREGARGEPCGRVGGEDAGRPIADEEGQEQNGERNLSAGGSDGGAHGEHANTRWHKLTGDAMSDDAVESGREAGAAEETKRAVTPEHLQEMGETLRKHAGDKDLRNKDIEVSTDSSVEEEGEVHMHEAESTVTREDVEDRDGVPEPACSKSDKEAKPFEIQQDFRGDSGFASLPLELQTAHDNSDTASQGESFVVEREPAKARRSQSDDVEETVGAVIEEESAKEGSHHRTIEQQDDDVKTLAAESEREDVLTEDVPRGEEVVQRDGAQGRAAGVPGAGRVDVARHADVQTKTGAAGEDETESTVVKSPTSAAEELSDSDRVKEGSKGGFMVSGKLKSVMEESEGETVQETAAAIKHIPTGISEGRLVGSEHNSPTCEETQKGVPENNNVPAQVFLEEGDCEETQGGVLPEEVETKEAETLQNIGCGTGTDYLVVMEDMEAEQESMLDVKNSFDAGLPREIKKPLKGVSRESGHLFEKEEGEFLVDCLMPVFIPSEKEFETHTGSTDRPEMDGAENGPQDGLEEISVDLEIDKGSCEPKAADAAEGSGRKIGALAALETFLETEEQKMTETGSRHVGEVTSEQNGNMAPSLLEDKTDSGFWKRHDETEAELLEDVKRQEAKTDVKETSEEVELVAAEDEMQSKNEMERSHEQVEELAECEVGSPEKINLQPIRDETLNDSEAPDESKAAESKAEDFILISGLDEGSCAKETVCSSSQGAIDDEVLDLWLQAASSKNDNGVQQQVDPRAGPLVEPYDEEAGEIPSLQKDEDQLVESNLKESEWVGHTETSSSTIKTGFFAQSGSFQGLYDTLAVVSESADISKLSEKEVFAGTGFHPDSGVPSPETRHLNRGSVEPETGSGIEIDAEASDRTDGGEVEAQSPTEWSFLYQLEKTQTEDEPLEMSASDSPDEIKGTEPGRSSSGSEASFEDEMAPTESRSQSNVCTESERKLPSVDQPRPGQIEEVAESSVGLDGAGHTTTEDQMEVESSALDFTMQRSRISVKNPRVRPPKDTRSLLNMPSLDPTPSQRMSAKVPVGGPLGGLGLGVKLPGLGGGFPVLKKTKQVRRDESSPETLSQETNSEVRSDTEDETQHKPKWMPPRHPGFGNPLMSELKTKLKKTTKE